LARKDNLRLGAIFPGVRRTSLAETAKRLQRALFFSEEVGLGLALSLPL
jgi:hypothetical protein